MIDGDPLVSVIIPTNRDSPYLQAALQSLTGQTWRSWELILVDDGSDVPDALERAVAPIPSARVVHTRARGLSAARNTGVLAATGEFVTFLDDDDIWRPERLEREVRALKDQPAALACYSSGWLVDSDGQTMSTTWAPTGASRRQLLLGEIDLPHIGTMVFRRDTVVAIGGFNTCYRYAEDSEFILRLLTWGELASVPEALFGYRRHPGSVMSTASATLRYEQAHLGLQVQLAGAEARGDTELAGLLRTNLAGFERRSAGESVGVAIGHARKGQLPAAGKALGRALRRSPSAALGSVLARGRSKVATVEPEGTGVTGLRLGAYVMLGDPAFLEESVRSYYDDVEFIVATYDADGRAWNGAPLAVDECVEALRRIDHAHKVEFVPGHFSDPGRPALEMDTAQRNAAMEQIGPRVDWVVQLDTDEVLGDAGAFFHALAAADHAGRDALYFPSRWLFGSLEFGSGEYYLEACRRDLTIAASYPGPVAVRAGTQLRHARQTDVDGWRVDFKNHNTDPAGPSDLTVDQVVGPKAGIWHYSWVRDEEWLRAKARASGHAGDFNWDRALKVRSWQLSHPIVTTALTPFYRGWDMFEPRHWLRITRAPRGGPAPARP